MTTCKPPHEFRRSLKKGKEGEEELDRYFGRFYQVDPVPLSVEKQYGIDRIFIRRGLCWGVEYKTDSEASATGNAFIEIVSDDNRGTPGWAKKSIAQQLIYYVRPWGRVYIFEMCDIKRALPEWATRFPERPAVNEGYNTIGLLVPMKALCLLPHIELDIAA